MPFKDKDVKRAYMKGWHRNNRGVRRSVTTENTLQEQVGELWASHNRPYYIDKELFMQLWDKHVAEHGHNCAVTGRAFDMTDKATRPSIDQISHSSGYWAWNIRFVTCAFNIARSNFKDAEVLEAMLSSPYSQPCIHVNSKCPL